MKNRLRGAPAWAPLSILLFCAMPAAAQLFPLGAPESVWASVGQFDSLREPLGYEAGWEVRFAPRRFRLLPRRVPDAIPTLGAMATSRGMLYTYAGLRWELPAGERWVFSPGLAAGLYYQGYGKNLGGALEFRSHVELGYRLAGGARVGLCIYHLSNAGIFDFNPGSESLVVTYTARLRKAKRDQNAAPVVFSRPGGDHGR
jgi:lipid A 3-O-deacylase